MTTSFLNGVSGLKSFQNSLDIWGDNIANVNTTGFKEKVPEFATLFANTISTSPITSDIGVGTHTFANAMDMQMGSFQQTDNPFDIAIGGDGWLKVKYRDKEYYTRDGAFTRDADGNLVNSNGAYLMVANANNMKKVEGGYEIDRSIDTSNLVATSQKLSPISLPNDLTLPAVATKNIKVQLNLNDDNKIETTAPATEESDFSALYNQDNEDMKIRNGADFIIGYGDNVTYNQKLNYEICLKNDEADGKDVNFDFNVNGKEIKFTLPDGSSKAEMQTALKEALDKAGIENKITFDGVEISDKDKLIIKSNTPLVKDVAAAKLTYKGTPTGEYEFNTIKSFEDIVQKLASDVYGDDAQLSFDKENGQIVMFNKSVTNSINSYILDGNNTNEALKKSIYPLENVIVPQTAAKSGKLKTNTQSVGGELYSADGEKDKLSLTFTKQKVLNDKVIWKLNAEIKDENQKVIETKDVELTFNSNGTIVSPDSITIDKPQEIKIDLSKITSFQKTDASITYSYVQDGIAKGNLQNYEIDDNGNINANFSNNQTVTLGQIPIMHFVNDQGLASVGGNMFEETPNSGTGETFIKNGNYIAGAKVKSSFLESSNVEMNQAMTELIITQKAFGASAKTVTTSDQMIQTAINMKR